MKKLFVILFTAIGFYSTAQIEGSAFFGDPVVHTIKFTFPYSNFLDSLSWSYTNDTYIKCATVEVDDTSYYDVGVKWKGNSSYTVPGNKKSFKVDFNEFVTGQDHDGLKKLNLNNCFKDPSFLREKLMLDYLNKHAVPAPRCTYTEVYINGTLWGLFTAVEEIDKTFLKNQFDEKKGNLFKGDPTGDLKWLGSSPSSYYAKYELKTNESENNWTDLVELINRINNTPAATYQDSLDAFFDTQKYIVTWAIHNLYANLDSYLGSGHNYYIYHDSLENKFRFISWDVNEAFGNFNMGMTISQLEDMAITYISSPASNRPLHQKMLANGYQDDLYDVVCYLVNYDFTPWHFEPIIDSLADVIRPYVYADPNKFFSNSNFEDNIEMDIVVPGTPGGSNIAGIKSFIANRRSSLIAELAANGCVVGVDEENMENQLVVYPNPASERLYLNNVPDNSEMFIYDLTGKLVLKSTLKNDANNMINIGALSKGAYVLSVKNLTFGVQKNLTLIKN